MKQAEFYVGYLPHAGPGLSKTLRRIVLGLLVAAAVISVLLVFGQARLPDSSFEFQKYREMEGVLREYPYPTLAVSLSTYLLVAPGKHGAADLVQGLDGKRVRLKGSLIYRDNDKMLELVPGSLRTTAAAFIPAPDAADLGTFMLAGEIVDSKCYLGVMNPGSGKAHRDCAARCISGGIPPLFVVKDASGVSQTLLLVAADGSPMNRRVLNFVAEPVEIGGQLLRSGQTLILKAEPGSMHRAVRE